VRPAAYDFLKEDTKRLAQSVEDAQDEVRRALPGALAPAHARPQILQMKTDVAKRLEKAKAQDTKYRSAPDIVIKVVARYRAELFFKISRKTKLARLVNAWTARMDGDARATFVFTHGGRALDAEQTPEDAGVEDGDEVLAVELLDLTDAAAAEDAVRRGPRRVRRACSPPRAGRAHRGAAAEAEEGVGGRPRRVGPRCPAHTRTALTCAARAKRTLEELFNGVCVPPPRIAIPADRPARSVRERLKEVLRQYELRERHFECVIRSKELEVLLSRARAAEQRQLAETEKARAEQLGDEVGPTRRGLRLAR
jgi:hypothetical protein